MARIKISVVGNCQARPIAQLLEAAYEDVDINSIAVVHLLKNDQLNEYLASFEDADYIVTQVVAAEYPCEFVRKTFLDSLFGSKLVAVHNLFYRGYNPELIYLRLKGYGPLTGPLGDYHHKTIFDSWSDGLTLHEAQSRLDSSDYWISKYSDIHEKSLAELAQRESILNVSMVDYIRNIQIEKKLFFTFNHPALSLLYEMVVQIANQLSLRPNPSFDLSKIKEPLDQFEAPVSEFTKRILNLKFSSDTLYKSVAFGGEGRPRGVVRYSEIELLKAFYEHYDRNEGLISKHLKVL